jgi:hypothetical protein
VRINRLMGVAAIAASIALSGGIVVACTGGSTPGAPSTCVSGASVACACPDGTTGAQSCQSGSYGACSCSGSSVDSGGGAADGAHEGGGPGDAGPIDGATTVPCLAPTCTFPNTANKGACICTEHAADCPASALGKEVDAASGCTYDALPAITLEQPYGFNCCSQPGYPYLFGTTATDGAQCKCSPWYCHAQPAGSTYSCVCASSSATPDDGIACFDTTCCLSDTAGSCECSAKAISCPAGYHKVGDCGGNGDICPVGWSYPGVDGCRASFVAQ